jgi:DinB superfamily
MLPMLVLVAGMIAAAPLTEADRAALVTELQASHQEVVETVKTLSPEQLAFKPAPDRWSVAECLEHISNTEVALFGYIANKVLATPAATDEAKQKAAGKDNSVMKMVTDRTARFQAPAEIRPSGKYATREAVLQAFADGRKKTLEFVKTTQQDLRGHVLKGAVGEMDGYQWLLYLSGHTRRHLAQIKEVMASPGFPK